MTQGNMGALIGQALGDYQLETLIGAGGMAEVYRGRDTKLGREVAVKILPQHFATDPGYVSRFREEARWVAAIDHPNIVPVYHFGEERGHLYIVMPLLRESLRDRMGKSGLPSIHDATRIAVQIAAALNAAHSQGIVHRDVKPENIMLNHEGRALLTDFGIAREAALLRDPNAARTISASGLPVGTPEYMAPEQLRKDHVDHRADIYALGAVLYEMLTGHAPHEAETVYEIAAKALTEPITPPSAHNPEVWPELEQVVLTALAKDPDDRYPTTRDFALALRTAVIDRPHQRMSRLTIPAYQRLERINTDAPVLRIMGNGSPVDASYAGDATSPAGAVSVMPRLAPDSPAPRPAERRRRVGILAGALLLLALVGLVGGGTLYLFAGFWSSESAQQSTIGTSTIVPGGSFLPGATGTVNQTTPPSTTPTTSGGQPIPATSTTIPTSIPTIHPTPTATPQPTKLILDPTLVKLTNVSGVCAGSVTITNPSTATLDWQATNMPDNWSWRLNNSGKWTTIKNGQPQPQGSVAGNDGKQILSFTVLCSKVQQVTITISNSEPPSTITVTYP